MKQKVLNALVEKRYAEALARVENIKANAQKKLDEDTAKKLGALCLEHVIEVFPSDDDSYQDYVHLVTYDYECNSFRFRLRKSGLCFVVNGKPDLSQYFDVAQSNESCIRFLVKHKKDIMDGLDEVIAEADERYWNDPDCFHNPADDIVKPSFYNDINYFISNDDLEFIRSVSKESIRKQVINENKKNWLEPEPAHHVRNNKTIRGHYVSRGSKGCGWRVRHDEFDKNNLKQYRDGSGKWDVAIHSRKERKCSEIRAHKRNEF